MSEAIQLKENFNETKKAAKRALFKSDVNKKGTMATQKFFKILEDHNIKLTEKNKSQSVHDFQDHNNGQINYVDALRYIQASDMADDVWEVTKAQPKLRTRGNEEKIMNTTGFTSLVFGSPTRKMYNTGAVTSP